MSFLNDTPPDEPFRTSNGTSRYPKRYLLKLTDDQDTFLDQLAYDNRTTKAELLRALIDLAVTDTATARKLTKITGKSRTT